jgi:2-polyprenyl-6-hydroxyphenyl methylase/3-demethylubiquinone-9 3-methyltransferase
MGLAYTFIESQQRLSRAFDRRVLPEEYSVDGSKSFFQAIVEPRLFAGATLYDVGGGRGPIVPAETKQKLGLRVVGLDISAEELSLAPPGAYDEMVCADIATYRGQGDADLVICNTLLEHVRDTAAAFRALGSIVKPGGRLLLFVPSRRAVFARLNVLLPEEVKRRVLFALYPRTRGKQGFPAYYDRCTPEEFRALARESGFSSESTSVYWSSEYFAFFAPFHVAWRGWVLASRAALSDEAAETFSMVLRKD